MSTDTTITLYREITADQLNANTQLTDDNPAFKQHWVQSNAFPQTVETHTMSGDYYLPETVPVENAQDYALRLIYSVLDEHRPDAFPPHNGSVFFFGSTDHTMNRQYRLTLELPFNEYEFVAASWDVAETLFMKTMRDFEIMHATTIDTLHERVHEYWESAFIVTSPDEITSGYEYYTPDRIDPSYVTEMTENANA